MRRIIELALVASLPIAALLLRGKSEAIVGIVLAGYGLALIAIFGYSHHKERSDLGLSKFAEYAALIVLVISLYLFLL